MTSKKAAAKRAPVKKATTKKTAPPKAAAKVAASKAAAPKVAATKPAPKKRSAIRVVMVASEAVPFSKTGGLADVASSLSKALGNLDHSAIEESCGGRDAGDRFCELILQARFGFRELISQLAVAQEPVAGEDRRGRYQPRLFLPSP